MKYFRQWYTLCTVNNPQVGTYFLQIETNTKIDGTAAPYGGGANRFALRAALGGSSTRRLQIYGDGRIGIYANSPARQHDLLPRPGPARRQGPRARHELLRRR